jgi:methionyl aminopeptidase
VRAGVTTNELDRIVFEACMERGAYPSPLNYHSFPKSVCTSVNEVICHGIPDMRPLQEGDVVNLDVSTYLNGFHADLNEVRFIIIIIIIIIIIFFFSSSSGCWVVMMCHGITDQCP